MPKWEYKLVGDIAGTSAEMHSFLNALGADGWELVLSAPEMFLVFKRSLPQ